MRKTFYTKYNNPILASGICLLYNNKLILQYEYKEKAKTKYLADFGGKIDKTDKSPYYGAIREFIEETNGYLYNKKHNKLDEDNKKKFMDYHFLILNNIIKRVYIKKSKYVLYLIKINKNTYEKIMELGERFDEIETEGLSHQIIEKYNLEDDIVKIHPRLQNIKIDLNII